MKKIIIAICLIILAVSSEFLIAPRAINPETYTKTMEILDKKRTTVLELTTSATAASLALGAVPGDATTPIASKIIDLTGYFIIVLCTIIMEKYLLTITGYVAFKILIPIACALFLLALFIRMRVVRHLAIRILVFAVLIYTVVPASVLVTQIIESTYKISINTTIEKAKEIENEVAEATTEAALESTEAEEQEGFWNSIFNIKDKLEDVKEDVQEVITEKVESVTELSEEVVKKAEDMMNDFIETVVVMLVTSCVIPMLVLVFFLWIAKTIIGMDFDWGKSMEEKENMKLGQKLWKKKQP